MSYRSIALSLLGYPESALADLNRVLSRARDLGRAASLMYALYHTSLIHLLVGDNAAAQADADELLVLAEDKDASLWKAFAILMRGCLTLNANNLDAIRTITQGIAAIRSTGATCFLPLYLPFLSMAYVRLNQFDEAWHIVGEAIAAIEETGETWCEAEVYRVAGEIAIKSPAPNSAKTEGYFERALAVARQQQAKSWELRAA